MPLRTQHATSIKGRKISPENKSTFILLLCALLVTVVLYIRDIYNCGPFLFCLVACSIYYYVRKEWNDVYEYPFESIVWGKKYKVLCKSNMASIDKNKINYYFVEGIIKEPNVISNFYRKTELFKLIIVGGGLTCSFLFDDLNCFTEAVSYEGHTITYTIKSNIIIQCGDFEMIIPIEKVPKIRSTKVSIK